MTSGGLQRALNLYLLPGALFGCTYLIFGFHYLSSDDATVGALIRGFPFGVPVTDFFFCQRITAIVYAGLFQLYPWPWFELATYTFLLVATINYFTLITDQLKHILPNWILTPLLVLAFVLFFLNSVISISFTEVSILLSASAIILALTQVIKASRTNQPVAWLPLIGYVVLFALGFLARPRAGLLPLGMLFPFAILQGRRSIWPCLRYVYLPAIALVGALQLYDYVTRNDGAAFFGSVFPYVANVHDFNRETTPLSDPTDVIRSKAVVSLFLGDRQTVNPQFLSKMAPNDSIDFERINIARLKTSLLRMYELSSKYQLAIALVLFLGASAVTMRGDRSSWRLLCFTALYWLPLLAVTLFLKMESTVLTPSIVTYVFAASVFAVLLIEDRPQRPLGNCARRVSTGVLWGMALVAIVAAWHQKGPLMEAEAQEMAADSKLGHALDAEFANHTIVFTMHALNAFLAHQPVLSVDRLAGNSTYILIDDSWPTLLPEYTQHLRKATGSDRIPDVFEYLHGRRDKVIFVSTPERNELIQEYLAAVYQKEYEFEPVEPRTVSPNWARAQLYRLK